MVDFGRHFSIFLKKIGFNLSPIASPHSSFQEKKFVTCNSLWAHPCLTFSSRDGIAFNRLRRATKCRGTIDDLYVGAEPFYTRAVPEVQGDEILKF